MKKICLLVLSLCAAFAMGGRADAADEYTWKVTFVNRTDRMVSVAWMHLGETLRSKGWYNIDPGKSRTLSWKAKRQFGDSGYYAKASKKGAKTAVWSGKSTGKDSWLKGPIHPTKAFDYTYDIFVPHDMEWVDFCYLSDGDYDFDKKVVTATVTLNL